MKRPRVVAKLKNIVSSRHHKDDCVELEEEIQRLEKVLKSKEEELFTKQRESYKHTAFSVKNVSKESLFVRPKKIILDNSIESLKRSLELMAMLTGTAVQSYLADDHCSVVFTMQHDAQHELKHGLRIEMKSGVTEITASSMPLGFKLLSVLEEFKSVMDTGCIGAIRKALVAYYDRLDQFQMLKKQLNVDVQLFKEMDGSHMELSLYCQSETEEDEQFNVVLRLDYRVYDIRPKSYSIDESDCPEGAAEVLRQQCAVFKKKPLHVAFKEAFMDDIGKYNLVKQMGGRPAPQQPRRKPRPNAHGRNDDTFVPEECSDQDGDDDDDDEISAIHKA